MSSLLLFLRRREVVKDPVTGRPTQHDDSLRKAFPELYPFFQASVYQEQNPLLRPAQTIQLLPQLNEAPSGPPPIP